MLIKSTSGCTSDAGSIISIMKSRIVSPFDLIGGLVAERFALIAFKTGYSCWFIKG